MEGNEGFQNSGTVLKSATVFLLEVHTQQAARAAQVGNTELLAWMRTVKSRKLKFCQHFPGQESWRWL